MKKSTTNRATTWKLLNTLFFLTLTLTYSVIAYTAERRITTIIYAGALLAVPGEQVLEKQTIIIQAGIIKSIERGFRTAADLQLPSNSQVIDLRESFVMPGFIDLHVHISKQYGTGGKLDRVTKTDSDKALTAAFYARKTLLGGFTTIRDLGSSGNAVFALRDAIREGRVPGPKILVAGDAITATGGHADIHGFRSDVAQIMASTGVCDGADNCRAAVRRQVKRGADVIKVTVTGGVLSETASGTGQQLTDEELEAIVATAHSLNRKVTAHAHSVAGIEAALRAGFDSIEHAMWADRDTMRLFNKTGAWLIPTVYPITVVGDTPEKMKMGPFKNMPQPILDKLLKLGRQPKDMTRMANEMGVKIALGTDASLYPHGDNANEFIEYVSAGMTPMQALTAGTIDAAKAAGIESFTGSIEEGKAADIVAMSASPLKDIRRVLDLSFIMRDGLVFKPAKLQ